MKNPIALSVSLLLLVATLPSQGQTNFVKVNNAVPTLDLFDGGGCAFVDYDNDGYVDLWVSNWSGNNRLYHNERNGTFRSVRSGLLVNEGAHESYGMAWGDYNNDGFIDLFVANGYGNGNHNFLYRNKGDGTFTKILDGEIVNRFGHFSACAWADYDGDGSLDLFVTHDDSGPSVLYLNDGGDSFAHTAAAPSVTSDATGAAWADFNNDGLPDLFVSNGFSFGNTPNYLYANLDGQTFERVADSTFPLTGLNGVGVAWGDYDNDGFPDVFVANSTPQGIQPNALYHNNGDETFTSVMEATLAEDASQSISPAWADYDNDGWLDLVVGTRTFDINSARQTLLYHNNGDGTLTRVTNGPIAKYISYNGGCAWGDYDNDGFLDLFASNFYGVWGGQNALFHNTGNSNHWLKVKCVGGPSNRSGIGAKVRVRATIGGQTFWQMREITTGDGFGNCGLLAHFGLGDATNVDTVRIEWPSGTVQVLSNVPARQSLTITEPPRLQIRRLGPNPPVEIALTGGMGLQYGLETSSDLSQWAPWTTVTCTNRTVTIAETNNSPAVRFYRALTH